MAGPLGSNGVGPFGGASYLPTFRPSSMNAVFKLDEGYSEDTRSQSGSDTIMRTDSRLGEGLDQDTQFPLPEWVLNMNEGDRSGMVKRYSAASQKIAFINLA